jgi:hypothetical protein
LQLIPNCFRGCSRIDAVIYTSFFPNRRNARNWAGVKIYIVALCWVVVLPVVNAHFVRARFLSKMCSTFYIGFVLILIFEILDLANDPHLHTVPQQIG